jgi:predicted negative regulator of RcsB-dependent stress response
MNNSIIVSNLALSAAYQHFQTGKIESAILEYQKALKNTFPEDLKVNIKCTIAVLEQSLGKYDQSLDLLSSVSTLGKHNNNSIVLLRAFSNLTLMEILEGRFTNAL